MGTAARHQPDGGPAGREPGEQAQLALVQARPPGDPERDAACEALVARYANIVRACAARYRDSPESAEDLMQVGYVGLMKAINNFDPGVGDSLAAYAQPCVSGEIKRHFRDKRWQIRVRRSTQELRLRIGAATADLTQELSRPPSDAELAARLGVTEAEVADAQLASQAFQVASLDAPVGTDDGSASLAELMGAEDPQLEHALDIESVWKHCAELPAARAAPADDAVLRQHDPGPDRSRAGHLPDARLPAAQPRPDLPARPDHRARPRRLGLAPAPRGRARRPGCAGRAGRGYLPW